jgi:membrane-bound metal-dependent hydrolase YbcI (DUF457 family)
LKYLEESSTKRIQTGFGPMKFPEQPIIDFETTQTIMASPVGHTLAALIACAFTDVDIRRRQPDYMKAGLFILAANAPDLDFIPGLLMGNASMFHHGINHSVGAAVLFSLVVWGVGRLRGVFGGRTALVCFLLFLSHLFIDWMTADYWEPYGFPALWPFSADRYHLSASLFWNIERQGFFTLPTLLHNLNAVLIEIAVMAPIVGTVWVVRKNSLFRFLRIPMRIPVKIRKGEKPINPRLPEC